MQTKELSLVGTLLIVLVIGLVLTAGCGTSPQSETPPATSPLMTSPPTSGSRAHQFYIASEGKDTNPGTADQPWRTLQHAADSAGAGDTVLIQAGTYAEEEVQFTRSGSPGALITFTNAPGAVVTLQGSLLLKQGTAYLTFSGLHLEGFRIWGITVEGDNHHLLFSNLQVRGGEAGIHFTDGNSGDPPTYGPVHDITLEDSTFRDAMYTAVDCTPGPCNQMIFRRLEIYGSGLEAGFGGDGLGLERGEQVLVEDCSIHDNGGDGIDLNSRDYAGNVPGILVQGNQVYRNHLQGIKLWAGGRMEKNVVWGQGIDPVMVGKHPCTVEVIGNTLAYNMYDLSYSGRDYAFVAAYPEDGKSAPVRLTLTNNIFAFNNHPDLDGHTGIYLGPTVTLVEEGHNLFYSREDEEILAAFLGERSVSRSELADGTWTRLTGQGAGDLTVDPLFVSGWPTVDLHLQDNSPAKGYGAY
jgi:hypothetical protein